MTIPKQPTLFALAACITMPVGAQTTDAFAGIPNITFTYYDVRGHNPNEIRKAINAVRPTDPNFPGKSYDGKTEWTMRWRWRSNGRGLCDLASTELTYSATVRLPRLVDDVSADVRRRWDRYIAGLERHEAGHARLSYDRRETVLGAIKGASCDTAGAAGDAALLALRTDDRQYDLETRHGETQGAAFP